MTLEASNDYDPSTKIGTWQTLFDSGVNTNAMSSDRNKMQEYTFKNASSYKHYALVLKKSDSPNVYIGHYGLVQSYLSRYVSAQHESITSCKVADYITPPPTDQPTSSPSAMPIEYSYTFENKEELRTAVHQWYTNDPLAEKYGAISAWNIKKVQDLSHLFRDLDFNEDITSWSTSHVTNMGDMFRNTRNFNQPINKWDTSSLKYAPSMFWNAPQFNQPLNEWDVSRLIRMDGMFFAAFAFNQPLNQWNTSSSKRMDAMFKEARGFNQPLNEWNVSSVTWMHYMFQRAFKFNQPLDKWDVSKVGAMQFMFSETDLDQNLIDWDISSASVMHNMFNGAKNFDQQLCWKVDGKENGGMFHNTKCGSKEKCLRCPAK